jgi:hypothetical protein
VWYLSEYPVDCCQLVAISSNMYKEHDMIECLCCGYRNIYICVCVCVCVCVLHGMLNSIVLTLCNDVPYKASYEQHPMIFHNHRLMYVNTEEEESTIDMVLSSVRSQTLEMTFSLWRPF